MFAFFEYLRNITYYLMFATVAGMLAPAGKYKKFVSSVLGFILLALMLQPLARIGTNIPVTEWFGGMLPADYQMAGSADWESAYTRWRDTYLREAFEAQLSAQLKGMLAQNGFNVYSAQFTYTEDFSRINTVHVSVSRKETEEAPRRVPFIRIQPVEPIRIRTQGGETEETPEPCPTATKAKNLISQFYNLSMEHIYVEVMH